MHTHSHTQTPLYMDLYRWLLMIVLTFSSFSFCQRNVKKESMKGFLAKNLLLLWHIWTNFCPQSMQLYIFLGIWPSTQKGRKCHYLCHRTVELFRLDETLNLTRFRTLFFILKWHCAQIGLCSICFMVN